MERGERLASSELTIKLSSPVSIVATDQAGFHRSGWKSLIDRQRRVFV